MSETEYKFTKKGANELQAFLKKAPSGPYRMELRSDEGYSEEYFVDENTFNEAMSMVEEYGMTYKVNS